MIPRRVAWASVVLEYARVCWDGGAEVPREVAEDQGRKLTEQVGIPYAKTRSAFGPGGETSDYLRLR